MNTEKQSLEPNEKLLFFWCILIGLLLRVDKPAEWSFINDELSTWVKLNYDSIVDLINNIKIDDSHPVGMYVFLYYWTAIFGTSEIAFKFPFLLMSIASMFLVYRIAALWFSKTTAIFVLAYFSTLQFPIWWSTIARQYQSGLFCTLVMAYCWTQILMVKKNDNIYWFGFVLAGVAAMYNHYFSFIFAAVIGVSGLLWLRKEILWQYLLAGAVMLLSFVPHIGITQYQLTHADGHEWYNPPTPSFLSNHFFYIFHYSVWCWGLMLILAVGSWFLYKKKHLLVYKKARTTALIWFLFPLLFGYFYSAYCSPILRESHLLFSFPYLLFFLLSYFPDNLPDKTKTKIVVLILLVNSVTLIFVRKHFIMVNTHPYEHFVVLTQEFLKEQPIEKTSIVLGENPIYLQYYKDAYHATFLHTPSFKPTLSFIDFRMILKKSDKSHLIMGNLPDAYLQLARDYYPYLYKKSYGINYEYYILSKDKNLQKDSLEMDFKLELNFDKNKIPANWGVDSCNIAQDTENGNFYYDMPSSSEWGPTFQMDLSNITPRNNEFIDIAFDIRAIDNKEVQPKGTLVVEFLNQENAVVGWKGIDIQSQTMPIKGWQRFYLTLRLAHEPFYLDVKNTKIKTFFWNKEKQAIHLDRFRIQSHKGNPILYGDTNNLII